MSLFVIKGSAIDKVQLSKVKNGYEQNNKSFGGHN
jgi:hypothetical protein